MSKKMLVETAFDIFKIASETVDGLRNKKVSVNEAKATNALLATMHHNFALRQEQARLSGARVNGDVIMNIKADPDAEPTPATKVIDMKPARALRGKRPAKRAAAG
jgi:hypothetical protein